MFHVYQALNQTLATKKKKKRNHYHIWSSTKTKTGCDCESNNNEEQSDWPVDPWWEQHKGRC